MKALMKPAMNTAEMANKIVRDEVYYCVSALISRLIELEPDEIVELVIPLPDWEESAIQAGWQIKEINNMVIAINRNSQQVYKPDTNECLFVVDKDDFDDWLSAVVCEGGFEFDNQWEKLANAIEADPYYPEIFEYWLVSDWLAEKLKVHNELCFEIHGLTVWGRTTTGQMIVGDCVIQQIAEELISKD